MALLNRAADAAHKVIISGLLAVTVVSGVFVFGSIGGIFQRHYERRQRQAVESKGTA